MPRKAAIAILIISLFAAPRTAFSQECTTLGQTPATAFPVCGITTFNQTTVPVCKTNDIFVPGCSGDGALYANKNPFWYKFTCYVAGPLGFLITPAAPSEDYDWQLYDITGLDPNQVFTNNTIIVTGNWAGTYGATGASSTGINHIGCGSAPAENDPTFSQMPVLIAGHEYLLMISHFTDTQSGYSLSFGGSGSTAVITDPSIPHMITAKTDCDGKKLTLKLGKKVRCNSLSATGSEFSILPAVTTITAASSDGCATGFDFDEVTLTFASALPAGNFQLVINNGSDGNSLLDFCDNPVPAGETTPFQYSIPQPIFADSIARLHCAPDSVSIYFPKKIDCSTIASNGSDFLVTGPVPVTVISAGGRNCVNGKSNIVTVKFATPISTKGVYQLTLKAGIDGTTVIDECGVEAPLQTVPFSAVDTVSAEFTYSVDFDCRTNMLHFTHDGAHDVNAWRWRFNNLPVITTQMPVIPFPSSSTNTVSLYVTNGVCEDSVQVTVVMDNEVKAGFVMPEVICPEDLLKVKNTSSGLIDTWQWNFDVIRSSPDKDPAAVQFPQNNLEAFYTIKLVTTNNTLNCSDSVKKTLRVLDNCFIAVPTGFTPNGDGLNDFLYPNNALKADNLQFSVFNRWGQLVFTTRNWLEKWNGKINGADQGAGVYVWFLRYTHRDTGKPVFQKGTTTLIR